MLRNRYLVIVMMIATALLSSCGAKNDLAPFLAEPSCAPPCWQQITPGESTLEDVKKRLSEIEGVDRDTIFVDEHEILFDACVRWRFNDTDQTGSICSLNNIVPFIGLYGNFGLTTEKTLSLYGEPDQLVYDWKAEGDFGTLLVSLFYREKGVVVSFKQNDLDRIILEPNNKIDYIVFYDPSLYPEVVTDLFRLVGKEDLEKHHMEWPGYVEIPIGN